MRLGRAILPLAAIAALGLLTGVHAYAGDPSRLTPEAVPRLDARS